MAKKIKFDFVPSEYQEKIFDWVQHGVGNALIRAKAGAGKSTTIKLILDQLRRDGGSIEIFGEDNTRYLQHGSIGVVFDEYIS